MAAFEHTRTIGNAELDYESIPKQVRKNFIADTFDAIDQFYRDPANKAKIAELKKKYGTAERI